MGRPLLADPALLGAVQDQLQDAELIPRYAAAVALSIITRTSVRM